MYSLTGLSVRGSHTTDAGVKRGSSTSVDVLFSESAGVPAREGTAAKGVLLAKVTYCPVALSAVVQIDKTSIKIMPYTIHTMHARKN